MYQKTKGRVSKFSQELLEKFDAPARQKMKEILPNYLEDNPDKYGADLLIKSDKCKYKYLELQVCTRWKEEKYPHSSIFIWERKGKYNNETLFLTLNRDFTMGYMFDISKVDKENPRRYKKYCREYVFDIPWNQVMLIHIPFLTKEIIEEF